MCCAVSTIARCERRTPFGLPIVPDVYIRARSESSSDDDGRHLTPCPAGHEILELKDPVVVPQLLAAHGDEVQQVRQLRDHVLEHLQIVDAVMTLQRDHHRDLGMAQLVLQLVVAEPRVHGYDRGTQLRGGEERDHPLRPVRHHDRDAIARPDSQLGQRGCKRRRLRAHPCVRERATVRHQHRSLRMLSGTCGQDAIKRPRIRHQGRATIIQSRNLQQVGVTREGGPTRLSPSGLASDCRKMKQRPGPPRTETR